MAIRRRERKEYIARAFCVLYSLALWISSPTTAEYKSFTRRYRGGIQVPSTAPHSKHMRPLMCSPEHRAWRARVSST